MIKDLIYKLLICIGIINGLTVIISALTGTNSYTIANNLVHFDLILCFIPVTLVGVSILWRLIDLFLKTEQRINYYAIAFCGILSDAIFVIGSLLFAKGR